MQNSAITEQLQNAQYTLGQLQDALKAFEGPASLGHSSTAPRPSVEISANGKIAVGKNGLDIDYRGSDVCPYGRSATSNKRPFEAIIVHHTAPTHSTDWYVQYQIDGDPARGGHFGYHFYIAPDGEIIQGAPLTKRTNHVKPSHRPQRRDFGRHASNQNAIGITCARAGNPSFSPTLAQIKSLKMLAYALCETFDVDFNSIYGHGEIQSDRHVTEGKSAAEVMREWGAATAMAGLAPSNFMSSFDDDLDDTPVHEAGVVHGLVVQQDQDGWNHGYESMADYQTLLEDDDDVGANVLIRHPHGNVADAPLSAPVAKPNYVNQSAIRNRRCTKNLERRLVQAVEAVYGQGCKINIYSGGQDRLGQGNRRTGSIRHDDFGQGGRAADVHVFDKNNRQITALELSRLGQYWLASRFGCVGHEMRGGGIHLDEWVTPPSGGGRFWTYAHSNNLPWGGEARQMLEAGAQGIYP